MPGTWQCSYEAPARQCLTSGGLIPILAEGSRTVGICLGIWEGVHGDARSGKGLRTEGICYGRIPEWVTVPLPCGPICDRVKTWWL